MLPFSYRCGCSRMHRKCNRQILQSKLFVTALPYFAACCYIMLSITFYYRVLPPIASGCRIFAGYCRDYFKGILFRVSFGSRSGLVRKGLQAGFKKDSVMIQKFKRWME